MSLVDHEGGNFFVFARACYIWPEEVRVMCTIEELQRIGIALRQKSPYFKDWNINGLQAFIRDGGCCVYCEKPLMEDYDVVSCVDHLLPRSIYPELEHYVQNLVAACADCNQKKRNFDPSRGKGLETLITEVRSDLIREARAEIERKRASMDWRAIFQTAKVHFRDAVAEYRSLRSNAA